MSDERDPEREPETGDNPVEAAEQAAGETDGSGEAYADTEALEQDLADLIGGGQAEPKPSPDTEPEGPPPAEGGALGDDSGSAGTEANPDDTAIPLDTEGSEEASPAAVAEGPSLGADGVPVIDDVVNPAVAPATGLSDEELQRLADHLAADVESRLDGIVVEAVDHEMERVSTALKNAIHRRLKARLPDIIAEFISESRSGK